jgi:RNA polymerase sigma-70 factor, ECF subfamily
MDTHLDNELASGFTKDSPEAFAALYRLYYAPLCHFAEKFVINRDDAKDIVSDVFYHLWHKAPKVNKSVKAFLYAAVRGQLTQNKTLV